MRKGFRECRALVVGSADGKAGVQQEPGERAHADPADPDEMYVYGVFEINLIHGCSTFLFVLWIYL